MGWTGLYIPETCIVFEYIVDVELFAGVVLVLRTRLKWTGFAKHVCVQGEECSIRFWIGDKSLLPHDIGKGVIEINSRSQSMDSVFSGDIQAVAGKESVVG